MDDIATPHDAFFRESFGRREIAQDFLRHHLPTQLLAQIDLDTLDISKDTYISKIKGDVLTRLVQLALRWIFSDQPIERLRELLALIEQVGDQATALEILESLLRYYVQGTQRVDEHDARLLLQQTATGDPIMQTFIDRYIEQGQQQGEAKVVLHLIERKFGPPSAAVRQRIVEADADTLLDWSERILTAESLDAVLH